MSLEQLIETMKDEIDTLKRQVTGQSASQGFVDITTK